MLFGLPFPLLRKNDGWDSANDTNDNWTKCGQKRLNAMRLDVQCNPRRVISAAQHGALAAD